MMFPCDFGERCFPVKAGERGTETLDAKAFCLKNSVNGFCGVKKNTIFAADFMQSLICRMTDYIANFLKENKMDLIKAVEKEFEVATDYPKFGAGDTITVSYKIKEGNKERIQNFRGVVIQLRGSGNTKTFTIRKMSGNIGVERIFPLYSPFIDSIELNKRGSVRRKRIFYLRGLTGKKARIKEKRF